MVVSGVGGSSITSFSHARSLRTDCLLFWNQIWTAFSVMLTFLEISKRFDLPGVEPEQNS